MAVNPLPPQAYTKETLQKAYAWLLTQNSSIKEMASTQDMLISLYLKAQRNGDSSLETPSIQNFKQELKSLANLMGDLQTQTPPPTNMTTPSSQSISSQTNSQTSPQTLFTSSINQNFQQSVSSSLKLEQLDPNSLSAIAQVRETLNLSSDTEALRALIALGIRNFKKI